MYFKPSTLIFASLLIFNSCTLNRNEPKQNLNKPNVLFISVDDMNDWVGCLNGHPQAFTPNLDRLAKRGILFANAHCAAPACNPSRAAVFSGKMPDKTGVWSNSNGGILNVSPETSLLPQVFKEANYVTLGTGKLIGRGDNQIYDEYFGPNQRWSPISKEMSAYTDADIHSKGTNQPKHMVKDSQGRDIRLPLNGMPSDRAPNKKSGESFDWGAWDVPDSDFGDTQINDWAIEKIRQNKDQQLFLGVGFYRPHIPLWAPKKYFERFDAAPGILPPVREDDLEDLSEVAKKWALEPVTAGSHATTLRFNQWQNAVEAYLACISYIDHEIGRLLDALDSSGMAENTLIVLWSDHGWHLGEKEHWGKWTGWERSAKVPFIIVPPKNVEKQFHQGRTCEQPVSLVDIMKTLSEFCNLQIPDDVDGQSLVPLLKEPEKNTGRIVTTYFDPGNLSLRDIKWRYIKYADGSEEFYNLKEDPNEWDNLIHDPEYKEEVDKFRIEAGKMR